MPEEIQIKIIDLEASTSSFQNFSTREIPNDEDAELNRGSILTVQNATETPISSTVQNISDSVIVPIVNNWLPIIMETENDRSYLQRRNGVRVENADSNIIDRNGEDIVLTLEEQRIKNEGNAVARSRDLEDIIFNRLRNISWWKGLFCIPSAIVASIFCTLPFSSFFPKHNHILHPEYWYEPIYSGYIFGALLSSILHNVLIDNLLNIIQSNKLKGALILFLVVWLTKSFVKTIIYLVWSVLMQYPFPMPFMGIFVGFSSAFNGVLALWFTFPRSWRKTPTFSKKFGSYVSLFLYFLLSCLMYHLVGLILLKCNESYQPIIASTLHVLVKINVKIANLLVSKASNGDLFRTKMVTTFMIVTYHMLYLTVIMGSITSFATRCTILAIKLALDIALCLQIVWTKKNRPEDTNSLIRLLQHLALNEIIQFMCPLSFMFSFVVAYNGKNSSGMAGIGLSMWQYTRIEDIDNTLLKMMTFLLLPLSSVVICSVLLWMKCNIHLFKAVVLILEEFGFVFIVWIGFLVKMVGISTGYAYI